MAWRVRRKLGFWDSFLFFRDCLVQRSDSEEKQMAVIVRTDVQCMSVVAMCRATAQGGIDGAYKAGGIEITIRAGSAAFNGQAGGQYSAGAEAGATGGKYAAGAKGGQWSS